MMCLQNRLLLVIHIACCYFRSAILQENITRRILLKMGFRQISRNEHLFAESVSLQQFLYFPNSHQVWGLLLTWFTFVPACILRECPILGRSVPQSRRCPGGVPVVSRRCPGASWRCPGGVPVVPQCPEHHFLLSSWCRSGVPRVPITGVPEGTVPYWCGRVVGWNGCGVVWWSVF